MALVVSTDDAEEWFFALLEQVEAGESVVIARDGRRVVRWAPVLSATRPAGRPEGSTRPRG